MDQLDMLWSYQQEDMACDKIENDIKRSPNRIKLIKNRDYILDQQNIIKRIETEVIEMADRVDVVKDAVQLLEGQLTALEARYESANPESLEEIRQFVHDAKRLISGIATFESEMKKLKKDAGDRDHQQHDIRLKAARVKADFDKLKDVYDVEYREKKELLAEQRTVAKEKTKGIDQALLDRYAAIKSRCVPPMAKLINDQCSGCNMSLPSVVLRNIRSGSSIVECETCGRMLIQ